MWVINAAGALHTINDDHPAASSASRNWDGWRQATDEEVADWAKEQAAQLVALIRADYVREKKVPPKDGDETLVAAIKAWYESQGLKAPSAAETKKADAAEAKADAAEAKADAKAEATAKADEAAQAKSAGKK